MFRNGLFFLFIFLLSIGAIAQKKNEVLVKRGIYSPFFRDKDEPDQEVGPLLVDKYPVTNAEFLEFLKTNPDWTKANIKSLFAVAGYLEHWASDRSFPPQIKNHPVVNVSWFAARKYCESMNKRLMTTAEWEYVADAQNPANLKLILDWYSQTGSQLRSVFATKENRFKLNGMHGLIWEWVEDYFSAIVAGDSRNGNEASGAMFCGSGSLRAKDPTQYATFMRIGHRSSLKANSVGRSLGFRCAADLQ